MPSTILPSPHSVPEKPKPRKSLSGRLSMGAMQRMSFSKKPAEATKPAAADKPTENAALDDAADAYDAAMEELSVHLDSEMMAAATVDAIQKEERHKRERKSQLERQETETRLAERKAALKIAARKASVAKGKAYAKRLVSLLVPLLAFALFFLATAIEEPPAPAPVPPKRICLGKLCVPLPK